MKEFNKSIRFFLLLLNVIALVLILISIEYKVNKWLTALAYTLIAISAFIITWKKVNSQKS